MPTTIVLKKKRRKWLREFVVVLSAVILTTVGIKAADTLNSGGSGDEVNNGPCPSDMVLVKYVMGDFCIDKYEASPGPSCLYGDPSTQLETTANLEANDCAAVSEENKLPWRNISQDQAAMACAKSGKRLPSHEEWYFASLGTPDNKDRWTLNDCQVDNNWSEQPGASGSGKDCLSSFGAYDMVGNVWEWVDGAANEGVLDGVELPEAGFVNGTNGSGLPIATNKDEGDVNYNEDYFYIKHSGWRGMARGGYWDNQTDAGQYSVYMVLPPSSAGDGIGFRCAK